MRRLRRSVFILLALLVLSGAAAAHHKPDHAGGGEAPPSQPEPQPQPAPPPPGHDPAGPGNSENAPGHDPNGPGSSESAHATPPAEKPAAPEEERAPPGRDESRTTGRDANKTTGRDENKTNGRDENKTTGRDPNKTTGRDDDRTRGRSAEAKERAPVQSGGEEEIVAPFALERSSLPQEERPGVHVRRGDRDVRVAEGDVRIAGVGVRDPRQALLVLVHPNGTEEVVAEGVDAADWNTTGYENGYYTVEVRERSSSGTVTVASTRVLVENPRASAVGAVAAVATGAAMSAGAGALAARGFDALGLLKGAAADVGGELAEDAVRRRTAGRVRIAGRGLGERSEPGWTARGRGASRRRVRIAGDRSRSREDEAPGASWFPAGNQFA